MSKPLNTTELCYEGDVAIDIIVNGKKYSLFDTNHGTVYLKYMFAKMLAGEFSNKDVPSFINLVKIIPNPDKPEEYKEDLYITKDIAISGTELVDISEGYPTAVTVTAYITYDMLKAPVEPSETADFYIYLLTKLDQTTRVKNKLAKFKIPAATLSYITPGTTATLNWTLKIVNKGLDVE